MPNSNSLDIAIATMINKDLKGCSTSNALSACECSSPELRQTFAQISQDGIRRQERLSQLMSQKGWYVPPPADQQTHQMLAPQLQAATQGVGTAGGFSGITGAGAGAATTGALPPLT
jgi:spore coat protein CotF